MITIKPNSITNANQIEITFLPMSGSYQYSQINTFRLAFLPPTSNPHKKCPPSTPSSPAFPQMRKMGFGGERKEEVGGAL
jgi:hypothetical protein